ncbi:hypothetical protein [Pedobacter sp. L105]|uniref:hypothetical protein n=1 Tax=Pedobacter sp. L105 TaxID=1641871 RepID=UPI00131A7130|nr:hypothetical protein [Pedobacter sp. L105]
MKTLLTVLKNIIVGLIILVVIQIAINLYKIMKAPDSYHSYNPYIFYTSFPPHQDAVTVLLLFIAFFLTIALLIIKSLNS